MADYSWLYLSTRDTDDIVMCCHRCGAEVIALGYFEAAEFRAFVEAAGDHDCGGRDR